MEILKIGEIAFPIIKSKFRYIKDNGEGSSGWEFDIQTDQANSLPEEHFLQGHDVRFYSQGDPIPIPLQEDLTGVEIFLEEPFDYWKLPFRERLRTEFFARFLNKPFEASRRAANRVYFTLYVFEHTELKHLSLKFVERKIENEDDLYKILITAKIPKGAVESREVDLTIETWIKRLPIGTYAKLL